MSAPTTEPPAAPQPETQPTPSAAALDPRLIVDQKGIGGYATLFVRRLRAGELGSLPVIIGLIVIWAIFWSQQHAFLSSQNLTNLVQQGVAAGFVSLGIVLVLLLGEVDLSVGPMFGATSALVAVSIATHHQPQALAIVFALLLGAGMGFVHGFFFSRLGVPSFVVTLAGFLAWGGLQLKILGKTGTSSVGTGFIHDLTFQYLDPVTGYVVAGIVVAIYAALQAFEVIQRRRAGLRPRPAAEIAFRLVLLAVIAFVAVHIFNVYFGTPLSLVIFLAFVVAFDVLIRRTGFGRRVMAVGGNIEAARRAGISVATIRLVVFVLSGVMAAIGSIFFLSHNIAVDATTGGATFTLDAIAAVVIGGTSLFGGRGSAYSALLGTLVIFSISNGMALLSLTSATQFIVTGAVTLGAVTLDSISRRSQRSSGRV